MMIEANPPPERPRAIHVRSGLLCLAIGAFFGVLLFASAIQDWLRATGHTDEFVWALDVDAEQSIYTWASVLLLALNSALVLSIALSVRLHRLSWLGLSLGLCALSLDEVLDLHNKVGHLGDAISRAAPALSLISYSWVLVGALVAIGGVVVFAPLIFTISPRVRWRMLIGGAVFVAGALGAEAIAGRYFDEAGATGIHYRIWTTIEEALEVAGQIIFLSALLLLCDLIGGVGWKLGAMPEPDTHEFDVTSSTMTTPKSG